MKSQVVQEIAYLLERAEEKIAGKTGEVMVELCWDVGCVLRSCDEEDLQNVSQQLSELFETDRKLFEVAYYFYKHNPVKKRAVRSAA